MFRSITTDFWLDSKVEALSSTAKYMLLYLFTNPKTTLTGCYEVSYRRAGSDMGLNATQAEKAMAELCAANVVDYCAETNEVLIRNWDRYNWTKSSKLAKPLAKGIESIKCKEFRNFIAEKYNSVFPDEYRIDTVSENEDTVPIGLCTVPVSISVTGKEEGVKGEEKPKKHKHGAFDNVLLTDDELQRLKDKYPSDWQSRIDDLSYYIGSKGDKYKSHYRTLLNWARKDEPKGKGADDGYWSKYD